MEKGMNKQEMKDFKEQGNNLNAMVPGMYSELPLKHQVAMQDPRRFSNLNKSVIKERPSGELSINAPEGNWRPQHRRAASLINLKPHEDVPDSRRVNGSSPVKKINRTRLEAFNRDGMSGARNSQEIVGGPPSRADLASLLTRPMVQS